MNVQQIPSSLQDIADFKEKLHSLLTFTTLLEANLTLKDADNITSAFQYVADSLARLNCSFERLAEHNPAKTTPTENTLQTELNKQRFIVETTTFLNTYFQYEHYFLLSEDDLISLEKMRDACSALELLLLEVPTHRTFSCESLSALFSSCTTPLFNILKQIKDVSDEADKIRMLAGNI